MIKDNMANSWAEVDLGKIEYNIRQMKSILSPESEIMGVVKGNAYSHGAVQVAKLLTEECGISKLAVANVEEALELKEAGINASLFILGGVQDNQIEKAVYNDIGMPLFLASTARLISESAVKHGKKARVHFAIDSGMRRIGVKPGDELQKLIDAVKPLPGLYFEGVFTHFCQSQLVDKSFTYEQLKAFKQAVKQLNDNNIEPRYIHCANSGAFLDLPETHFNLVRPGSLTYGNYSSEVRPKKIDLKPALEWKSRITYIKYLYPGDSIGYDRTYFADKKMKVATVGLGFGDGYLTLFSNKGYMIVRGKKVPIVGKVCMDQCFIDVSELENVSVGDEVIILGGDGDTSLDAFYLGQLSGLAVPEILSVIGKRVPRIYKR